MLQGHASPRPRPSRHSPLVDPHPWRFPREASHLCLAYPGPSSLSHSVITSAARRRAVGHDTRDDPGYESGGVPPGQGSGVAPFVERDRDLSARNSLRPRQRMCLTPLRTRPTGIPAPVPITDTARTVVFRTEATARLLPAFVTVKTLSATHVTRDPLCARSASSTRALLHLPPPPLHRQSTPRPAEQQT